MTPRTSITMFVLLASALLLGACTLASDDADTNAISDDFATTGGLVVATTSQIGAIAEEVVGDAIEVMVLLGPGVDPHDYEPTAQEVGVIASAGLVLRHGLGLDEFLDGAIEGSGSSNVVTVTEGIELRVAGAGAHADEDGEEEDAEHAGEEGEFDPHVWHDPTNVKLMIANVTDALVAAFPDHAATFRTNGRAYQERMDEVDAEIAVLMDSIPDENRKVVSSHDSFGYFLARYGLEFIGAVIPTSPGGEASARDIAELQETIESEGVQAIFAETSVDPKIAEQLASDTGVTIVDDLYGDTLGPDGSGAETVDGMLLHNARRIADALR